jgi:SAM-dependent methyltransferase
MAHDKVNSLQVIEKLLKKITPGPIKTVVRRIYLEKVLRKHKSLELKDVFEHVYTSNLWKGSCTETGLASGLGSTGKVVDDYCSLLSELIARYGVRSVADLGCGNFNVGERISRMVDQYTGVDIAETVVIANTRAFTNGHIRFLRADLTTDSLPGADAAILRQVLQHLSNTEIQAVLDNVLETYPLAIITEHVYHGQYQKPNVDMAHGPATRVSEKSGAFIDQPPFSITTAEFVSDIPYAQDEVFRTWVVRGSRGDTGQTQSRTV